MIKAVRATHVVQPALSMRSYCIMHAGVDTTCGYLLHWLSIARVFDVASIPY